MEGVRVGNTQVLGSGDAFRIFYVRLRGDSVDKREFKAAIEGYPGEEDTAVRKIEAHEQGPAAGYYAHVLALDPGTAPQLFPEYIVTAQHDQPGYGEFRRAEVMLVGHGGDLLVDAERAMDRALGWLTSGSAAEDLKDTAADVGRFVGSTAGETGSGLVESFGPVRSGVVVLGAAAAAAFVLSRTL